MSGSARPVWGSMDSNSEFEAVASLSDLAEGAVLQRVRPSGDPVSLVRFQNEISALSAICPHQHFSMARGDLLTNGTLQCPWHGASYDCRTGEVKQAPPI